MRVVPWIDGLRDDVRFALRQLWRAPAFTAVAALTLALGIGANSAIFALVDATLLRPLPFPDADRLVLLWESSASGGYSHVSLLNLADWSQRSRTFARMAAYRPGVGGMVMNGADGTSETVSRQWVTAGFFEVLGVQPIAGRTFTADDNRQKANVAVLSESFWHTRFAADPTVVGRVIRFDGDPYTIVGIMPEAFQPFGRTSMWAMQAIDPQQVPRTARFLRVIGRMKPGIAPAAAQADLTAIAEALAREYPDANKGRGVAIQPLHDALVGSDLRRTAMLFLGVVGFVLLICCANVANLLLARATVRTRELAVRSALGAGGGRIVRQLITESLILSAIGGLLGIGIGAAILQIAPSIVPAGLLPTSVTLVFDARIVAFCVGAALLVGLLFGLAPAWQSRQLSAAQAFASDSRSTTGRGGRMRGALVAAEVATAVLLLFGAGLLLRTLIAVTYVDPGYRAEGVLTMLVDPLASQYPTSQALLQFFDRVKEEVEAVPGVRRAAWSSTLPMGTSEGGSRFVEIVGDPPPASSQLPVADYAIVSDGYFATLDLPIVAGRAFTTRDRSDSVPVCIVNEAFVRAHLRGRSPIGMRVALRPTNNAKAAPVVREIVGVSRQVKGRPDEADELVQLYVPFAQSPLDDIYLVVRPAAGQAESLGRSVRAAIGRIDRDQLVSVRDVMTLEEVAWEATARHRFRAVLVMTFAGLALLLAMVGVFGILAYSVQQRTRDFAVRRALGATTSDVLRLVTLGAARVLVIGAIAGLVLSAVTGRLLATMLFGVQPLDALTFVAVTMLLALTGALAVAGPAWRATRIDPVVALRNQ